MLLRVTVDDSLEKRVFTFAKDVVNIGRAASCDVVLRRDSVSRLHARLFIDHATNELRIQDLTSTSGTYVAEQHITAPQVLGATDQVRIGDVRLSAHLDLFEPEDVQEREAELLKAIRANATDDDLRAVYADWLEEHGKHARAEFLREQMLIRTMTSVEDPAFQQAAARLRKLATHVSTGWRAHVAMVFVEPCGREVQKTRGLPVVGIELACPKRWDEMTPTTIPGVRTCNACKSEVVYCATIDEARQHTRDLQGCVAIDIAVPRSPNDLTEDRSYSVRGRPAPSFAFRGPLKP